VYTLLAAAYIPINADDFKRAASPPIMLHTWTSHGAHAPASCHTQRKDMTKIYRDGGRGGLHANHFMRAGKRAGDLLIDCYMCGGRAI